MTSAVKQSLNALDASLVNQVGSGAGTGFSPYKDLDPSIIGSVSRWSTGQRSRCLPHQPAGQRQYHTAVPRVPVNVSPPIGGPDPYLYFTSSQAAGQTATETFYLDVTDANGVPLSAFDEAIGFDASVLQVSDMRGAWFGALASYSTAGTADNSRAC